MTALTPDLAERIARTCHAANREQQLAAGEPCPSLPWEQEPEKVRLFAVAAVEFALRGGTPEDQFRQWRAAREADGWTWGPVKDPDLKTHPCMVASYAGLPEAQRLKDAVFAAIVRAMSGTEGRGFLRVPAVARLLGVSAMTVYRLIESGELRGKRFGSSFRVRESDLEAYVAGADAASLREVPGA